MPSSQRDSAIVAEREGVLPRPMEPYLIQTVAEIDHRRNVLLQVYWPAHGEEPLWWVAQRGGAAWMDRAALLRLRDEIDRVLA